MRTLAAIAATIMTIGIGRAPGFAAWQTRPDAQLPVYTYTVVHTYPHDRDAFTQGLQYLDGVLYEGTGLNGRSSIRRVKIETGEVLQKRDVPEQYFGEGIAIWKSELFQLTYLSGVAFVYDRHTFAPKRSFKYAGEGWGLTQDHAGLIMSDGTEYLRFIDPSTGRVKAYIDLRGLLTPRERASTDVLNGIAFDAAGDRLFVTGKLWPKLFEVKLALKK